ncbi:MAG: NAD(P)H-hydrate dehydratase, partial [Finegoldia magna]|nr:NAD(P)H-hydrate dehydratase [Finegoldia magna]
GMATAGSGDCLSGIIASFMHNTDVFEACKLGVYIHGLAGDFAKQKIGEDSIIASDIIRNLPEAINACKEK